MLVQINKLQKKYKDHEAVKSISFEIERGRCIALLGPNGAGKTTTLQMLAGLLTPTSGEISFNGAENKDYRPYIGFLPQHPSFFNWMTPKEFLQFAGKLSNIPNKMLKDRIEESLTFVSLLEVQNKKIGGFSGGMKQRLGLAQALLHKPELLILDEPVSALDPAGRRDVLQIIHALKSEMTILFSTHVLHDAEQVCEEVIMLKDGEIKWDGTLPALKEAFATSAVKIITDKTISGLDSIEFVTQIDFTNELEAIVYLQDDSVNTNELLHYVLSNGYTVNHFEKLQDSLEDAYIRVMES